MGGLKGQFINCVGQLGNSGGDDTSVGVMIGIFTPSQGLFCMTDEAAALNTSGDERHINVSPDGLHAIIERLRTLFPRTVSVLERAG